MEHIPPPPPNLPKQSTWLPTSITSGFKARTKPRSLVSLADWFNNDLNYDLLVSTTADITRATDPQHHFKCHQFVIHLRSAALLTALLTHQIGQVNHVPVVYLPELLAQPALLGYLLRLLYDDQLVEQDETFRSLAELYKRYDMHTLLYALDPLLLSDTQRTRHSQLLASDLTRVTPQLEHVTPFSDCRVTVEGVTGTYYCHSIVLQNIATLFGARDNQGQYTWVIRARDIHPLLEGQEAALLPCLDAVFKYFYSGSLTLNGFEAEQLFHLSLLASHYGLTGVKKRCEARLTSHVTAENCCQLLILAHRYHVLPLQTEFLDYTCNALPAVMAVNAAFSQLPRELVRDYRAGPHNVFHFCLNAPSAARALKTLRTFLGDDAVPLLTAVVNGQTLIHIAIVRELSDACQTLIDMQLIDLEARTSDGQTALKLFMNQQPRSFSESLFCSLLNAGVRLDYLVGYEILRLLSLVPRVHGSRSAEHRAALARLTALYHQHSAQPWMSSLWTEERVLAALAHENYDCVGLLWTHFRLDLPPVVHRFENTLRVIDTHKVGLIVNGLEHVIDMRVAKFRVEERLVNYGPFDDYEYDLHVTHEGEELVLINVVFQRSDEFMTVLKFMYVINRAPCEDYEQLFGMPFGHIIRLIKPASDVELPDLETYFVHKCNIQ